MKPSERPTPYPLASIMAYKDSYLWRLRQAVGSELVLMPGAMVAVLREDRRVLLTKRVFLPGTQEIAATEELTPSPDPPRPCGSAFPWR